MLNVVDDEFNNEFHDNKPPKVGLSSNSEPPSGGPPRRRPKRKRFKIFSAIVLAIFVIGGTLLFYKEFIKSKNNNETEVKAEQNGTNNSFDQVVIKKETPKVKGLYLTGWVAGSPKIIAHYIELANNTEINSYVIDIKDVDGYLSYKSDIPSIVQSEAWKPKYDVDKVVKDLHDQGIYVIGRLVCFKDPVYSSKHPECAIRSSKGGVWKDNHGLTWINPYSKESWKYIADIAKEATQKGFDEIQLDYVRFANDGSKALMNFGQTNKKKDEIINEFLAYLRSEMPNVTISADIFGIACESPGDMEDIGQNLETIGKDVDYICPMVYPSHYAAGQFINRVKFIKPDLEPYGVVYNSLVKAKGRITGVVNNGGTYKAKMRPYLQDFTATWLGKGNYVTYGPQQVRQQIKGVYDAGYDEWILWSGSNTYSEGTFEKDISQKK